MKYYTSGRNFTFKEAEKEFQTDAKCEMNLIKAYPKITYQEILGMGGALTESAAYTYAQMLDILHRIAVRAVEFHGLRVEDIGSALFSRGSCIVFSGTSRCP